MNKAKEFVWEKYNIPPDVLGLERICITGNREIYIENYKSIVQYSAAKVVLLTETGLLHICGKNITIGLLCKNELLIKGVFEKLYYEI